MMFSKGQTRLKDGENLLALEIALQTDPFLLVVHANIRAVSRDADRGWQQKMVQ